MVKWGELKQHCSRQTALGGKDFPSFPPAAVGTPFFSRTTAGLVKPTPESSGHLLTVSTASRLFKLRNLAVLLRKTGR